MCNPNPTEGQMITKGTSEEIRIYMACLAAYNNGILHGRWIDATIGADAIWSEIKEMLATSPIEDAEEHAIHDYEGFGGRNLSEYSGIDEVVALADFMDEYGALGGAVLSYYSDVSEARRALDDHYAGAYKSVADFAEEMTEQSTDIPQALQHYIDYEAMGRDMTINDVTVIEVSYDEVHIFWQH